MNFKFPKNYKVQVPFCRKNFPGLQIRIQKAFHYIPYGRKVIKTKCFDCEIRFSVDSIPVICKARITRTFMRLVSTNPVSGVWCFGRQYPLYAKLLDRAYLKGKNEQISENGDRELCRMLTELKDRLEESGNLSVNHSTIKP